MHFRIVDAMLVMPVSSRFRPCKLISTTNRKCHKLFAVFLVNIWIVQSCYFVHCLHLPRSRYYTQCHHSMSSFSPLVLLHHLHCCIIFLFIFRTVLAFIIIVLTSITAINAIAKVFASIYMIFITVSFFSSSSYSSMGVVLIFIIVSIIIGTSILTRATHGLLS